MVLTLHACPVCNGAMSDQPDNYGERVLCLWCGYAEEEPQPNLGCDTMSMKYIGAVEELKKVRARFTEFKIENTKQRMLFCPFENQEDKACGREMTKDGEPYLKWDKSKTGSTFRRKMHPYKCTQGHHVSVTSGWAGWA